jgi:hypothetical protein
MIRVWTSLRRTPRSSLLAIICTVLVAGELRAQETADPQLEAAIAMLRNIHPAQLSNEEMKLKSAEMDRAWGVIQAAGARGVARLKQEIAAIDQGPTKDDFFKLDAAHLLWRMARFDECQSVADIWANTPLDTQYDYVFDAAIDAAKTQDPRALPMLSAILRDDKGDTYIVQHALRVQWPLTHVLVWETFGPQGLPALLTVLTTSRNPVELRSTVVLLARSQYLEALPGIRRLAASGEREPRCYAVEALGKFGHPADYDLLTRGLRSPDPRLRAAHIRALADYGDCRAVPSLIELLQASEGPTREDAINALACLLTVDALDALQDHALNATTDGERRRCRTIVDEVVSTMSLDRATYAGKPRAERERLLGEADPRERDYRPRKDDRTLTHGELLDAAKDWQQRHRITDGPWAWVESRHVLAAATPADLDLLLRVRASLYWRLSDECLYETDILNELIQRLGRSRYRQCVGICPIVEPAAAPASTCPAEPNAGT